MRLIVDTSVLVGELLRSAGRDRLADVRLDLFLPEQMWGEARIELPRRIRAFVRRRELDPSIGEELSAVALAAIDANVAVVDTAVYAAVEDEARSRSLRDRHDWPVVACALDTDGRYLDQRQRLSRHRGPDVDHRVPGRMARPPRRPRLTTGPTAQRG